MVNFRVLLMVFVIVLTFFRKSDLAWCTDDSNTTLLASACAEGKVFLSKISLPHVFSDVPENVVYVERIQTFHLPGAVEALCFLDNGSTLCCYARGTSCLSYFDLKHNFKLTKHSVNGGKINLRIPKTHQFDIAYLVYCYYQSKQI